jgi:hypothetical protein
LARVFDKEIVPMLKAAPGVRPVAIFKVAAWDLGGGAATKR